MTRLQLLPAFLCLAALPSAAPAKTANLFEAAHAMPHVGSEFQLSPEWVGTVKRVHLYDPANVFGKDIPDDRRLTHAWVKTPRGDKKGNPILQAGSRSRKDSALYGAPIFVPRLPSAKVLAKMDIKDLTRVLGMAHDGGGYNTRGESRWGQAWTCFTFESPSRLRIVNIQVNVRQAVTHSTSGRMEVGKSRIDAFEIREGILHPADPDKH